MEIIRGYEMLNEERIERRVNLVGLLVRCVSKRIITVDGAKALSEGLK